MSPEAGRSSRQTTRRSVLRPSVSARHSVNTQRAVHPIAWIHLPTVDVVVAWQLGSGSVESRGSVPERRLSCPEDRLRVRAGGTVSKRLDSSYRAGRSDD